MGSPRTIYVASVVANARLKVWHWKDGEAYPANLLAIGSSTQALEVVRTFLRSVVAQRLPGKDGVFVFLHLLEPRAERYVKLWVANPEALDHLKSFLELLAGG